MRIRPHSGMDRLIEQFPMPAIVANRYQDVLAANPIARALSPGFMPGAEPGSDSVEALERLRATMADP